MAQFISKPLTFQHYKLFPATNTKKLTSYIDVHTQIRPVWI